MSLTKKNDHEKKVFRDTESDDDSHVHPTPKVPIVPPTNNDFAMSESETISLKEFLMTVMSTNDKRFHERIDNLEKVTNKRFDEIREDQSNLLKEIGSLKNSSNITTGKELGTKDTTSKVASIIAICISAITLVLMFFKLKS